MLTYQIDNFDFLELRGQPGIWAPQLEPIVRPGVDDVSYWFSGSRGRPFVLQSIRDVATLEAGRELMANYAVLIGADPVNLIWASINLIAEGWKVKVEEVRSLQLRKMVHMVGGLEQNATALLMAEWFLRPVHIGI